MSSYYHYPVGIELVVEVLNCDSTFDASHRKSRRTSFLVFEDGDAAMFVFEFGCNLFTLRRILLEVINNNLTTSC